MKSLRKRANIVTLNIVIINILMARVTSAAPFQLWDVNCADGTLKVSLEKRQPSTANNNQYDGYDSALTGIVSGFEKLAFNDDITRSLKGPPNLMPPYKGLTSDWIGEYAKNITKDVQAAGVHIKEGVRVPTLVGAETTADKAYAAGRQERKTLPELQSTEQKSREFHINNVDEMPNENIESFLAELDGNYDTRGIVDDIVRRVLKETPTTTKAAKEENEIADFLKTQAEPNRAFEKGSIKQQRHEWKEEKDDERDGEITCDLKCKAKIFDKKPKVTDKNEIELDLEREREREREREGQSEREKVKEKEKDNEAGKVIQKDPCDNKNKCGKKPKVKISIPDEESAPCDQEKDTLCKMRLNGSAYDIMRTKLLEDGVNMKKFKAKLSKSDDDDSDRREHFTSKYENNEIEEPTISQNIRVKLKKIDAKKIEDQNSAEKFNKETEEQMPEEEEDLPDEATDEPIKNVALEKSYSQYKHFDEKGNKLKEQKSKLKKTQSNDESLGKMNDIGIAQQQQNFKDTLVQESKFEDQSINQNQEDPTQLESPDRIEFDIKEKRVPTAKFYKKFAKMLNYENEDWYKKLMNENLLHYNNNELQNKDALAEYKFKKSIIKNDRVPTSPERIKVNRFHNLKILGKRTKETIENSKQKKATEKVKETLRENNKDQKTKLKELALKAKQLIDKKEMLDKEKELNAKKEMLDKEKELKNKKEMLDKEKELKDKKEMQVIEKELNDRKEKLNKEIQLKDKNKLIEKESNGKKIEEENKKFESDETEEIPNELKPIDPDDAASHDYFNNLPAQTARIMLLKTISAEILELEAIRNRTLDEFKNAELTTECIPEESTTDSEPVETTTIEPETTTTVTIVVKPSKVKPFCRKKIDMLDGVINLPYAEYDASPSDSIARLKQERSVLYPRHISDKAETDEEFDDYDDDDDDVDDDGSEKNRKSQTRRQHHQQHEQQQYDYEAVSNNDEDYYNDSEMKDAGNAEVGMTVMVDKHSNKSDCEDKAVANDTKKENATNCVEENKPSKPTETNCEEAEKPKEISTNCEEETKPKPIDLNCEPDGKPKINVPQENNMTCGNFSASSNTIITGGAESTSQQADLDLEALTKNVNIHSKATLEIVVQTATELKLPITKKWALKDLHGSSNDCGTNTNTNSTNMSSVKGIDKERELFRIMAMLYSSGGGSGSGKSVSKSNECKKTDTLPTNSFMIF